MNAFDKLKSLFSVVDPMTVAAYQTVLPKVVHVQLKEDSGYIIAKIEGFEDKKVKGMLITEAKDMDSLVDNVNDLVFTYVKMPPKIRPYYGQLFKPEGHERNAKELTLVKA